MGTRGCVGWTVDGENYVETYIQYDSYPEGLGNDMLEVIKTIDIEQLKNNISSINIIKDSADPAPKKCVKKYAKFSENPNKETDISWYWVLRKLQGAAIIEAIANGKVNHVIENKNWMKDSLFCEYGYTLNFKTNELELWEGFQKVPQKGNPFGESANDEYYPCKKVGATSFSDIKEGKFELEDLKKFYK